MKLFIVIATLSSLINWSIARVEDVYFYAGVKNDKGEKLADFILPFSKYDLRKNKEKKGVRAVVTGCVRCPGVYIVDVNTNVLDLLKKSGYIKIKEHVAHSYLKKVNIYRRDKVKHIDVSKEGSVTMVEDGDVINIKALII